MKYFIVTHNLVSDLGHHISHQSADDAAIDAFRLQYMPNYLILNEGEMQYIADKMLNVLNKSLEGS